MKYSLVTGGSRGLGRAVCIKLAQMGIPVIINYQSNEKAAEEVRDLIIAQGGQASLMKFNVADKDEVSAALEAWEKAVELHVPIQRFAKSVGSAISTSTSFS